MLGELTVLTGKETAELLDFVTGQNSDGYGEGFEQRPIKTPDGEIYVSFWNHENYFVKSEHDMKQKEAAGLGYEHKQWDRNLCSVSRFLN